MVHMEGDDSSPPLSPSSSPEELSDSGSSYDCTTSDRNSSHGSEDDDEDVEDDNAHAPSTLERPFNINQLPPEIFSLVLEWVCGSSADITRAALDVSHVSQHWRSLALATPKLWTKIEAQKDDKLVELLLHRSKRAPLHIQLSLKTWTHDDSGFMQIMHIVMLVLAHRDRIDTLTCHFYSGVWLYSLIMSPLFTFPPTLEINSLDLRHLELPNVRTVMDDGQMFNRMDVRTRHFRYDGSPWSSNSAPIPVLSKSLISLDLRWSKITPRIALFVGQLAAADNLERLRIISLGGNWADEPLDDDSVGQPHLFSSLQEVELEGFCPQRLHILFDLLQTPSLRRLSINFSNCKKNRTDLGIVLLSITERHPQLQQLHLKFCERLRARKWEAIMANLPNLKDLRLSYCQNTDRMFKHFLEPSTVGAQVVCPKLSSITLIDNFSITIQPVIALVMSRLDARGVSPIESVTCKGLSLEDARRIANVIGTRVSELVLECYDFGDLARPAKSDSAIEEEWIGSGDEADFDSGDEAVLAQRYDG